MDKHLHIVSFAVPYPVVHGGLFDLYFKIRALAKAGVKIHLHCLDASAADEPLLDQYCMEVHYYRRRKGLRGLKFGMPYIVSSRCSNALAMRLLRDNHPVLLEGIHSTCLLTDDRFATRVLLLRLHNIESTYYRSLYHVAADGYKKWYYLQESRLLERYEARIAARPNKVLAVSAQDAAAWCQRFSVDNAVFLPVFTPFESDFAAASSSQEPASPYCLYHGNLSVPENEKAATWLIQHVFRDLDVPLVIAGRQPTAALQNLVRDAGQVTLVANPSSDQLDKWMRQARCHVLPSFNRTGVKLKLIHALYAGGHCIVNAAAAAGSDLEQLCVVSSSAEAFREAICKHMKAPLGDDDYTARRSVLKRLFDPAMNAERLIRLIW